MEALFVIGISAVLLLAALSAVCLVIGIFPSKWADRLVERRKRGNGE